MVPQVLPETLSVTQVVHEFRAMNTDWWILARGQNPAPLTFAEAIVLQAEAEYSRFRSESSLSRLNRDREAMNSGLAAVVRRSLDLFAATNGAFDIRVGPSLVAAGYDRSFELLADQRQAAEFRLAPPVEMLSVGVLGDIVRLDGTGALDLGGVAKGWTIDRVAEAIRATGCRDFLIDGGGDIRASGTGDDGLPWVLGVGGGLAVRVGDGAVCTSSVERRRWRTDGGKAHHIIDPSTGEPAASQVTSAAVVAPDAATADALATALIANPSRALAALPKLQAEALFERNGTWEMTPGMGAFLI